MHGTALSAPQMLLNSNKLTGMAPTQLGRMSEMASYFRLDHNSISSAIPTQLGLMSEMASYFRLESNNISSSIPTQLGQMTEMTEYFHLFSNKVRTLRAPRPTNTSTKSEPVQQRKGTPLSPDG